MQSFCRWIAVLGAAIHVPHAAQAQTYPTRPLRMIIPAGSGGGVDTVARIVGTPLAAALGQPVVMENRTGAGTMLASELTAKSPPDGYTLLMVTNSHAINAGIHKNLRYDPVNDFSPISFVTTLPYVKSKRLIALGISTARLSPLYPGLPTIASSGLPDYESDAWYGVIAPARLPADIVARLNREINAILRTAGVKDKLAAQGTDVAGSTPEEFAAILRRDIQKWAKVTAGLKLQIQ